MRSIKLTKYGETLLKWPDSNPTDKTKIPSLVGIHAVCEAAIDMKEISKTHNALCCRSCGLRVVIPKQVDTFGKLRNHIHESLKARK